MENFKKATLPNGEVVELTGRVLFLVGIKYKGKWFPYIVTDEKIILDNYVIDMVQFT